MASFLRGFAIGAFGEANKRFDEKRAEQAAKDKRAAELADEISKQVQIDNARAVNQAKLQKERIELEQGLIANREQDKFTREAELEKQKRATTFQEHVDIAGPAYALARYAGMNAEQAISARMTPRSPMPDEFDPNQPMITVPNVGAKATELSYLADSGILQAVLENKPLTPGQQKIFDRFKPASGGLSPKTQIEAEIMQKIAEDGEENLTSGEKQIWNYMQRLGFIEMLMRNSLAAPVASEEEDKGPLQKLGENLSNTFNRTTGKKETSDELNKKLHKILGNDWSIIQSLDGGIYVIENSKTGERRGWQFEKGE